MIPVHLSPVLETLRTLPNVVEPWFRKIPADQIDLRRLPEAWTLREHLYHIAGVQPMLLGRMHLLAEDPKPVIRPYFPQNEPALAERYPSVDEAFRQYRDLRSQQMDFLNSVPEAAWTRPGEHPEYSAYDLELVVHHLVFHEYWHFYRTEELWLTRPEYLA